MKPYILAAILGLGLAFGYTYAQEKGRTPAAAKAFNFEFKTQDFGKNMVVCAYAQGAVSETGYNAGAGAGAAVAVHCVTIPK